MIMVDKENLDLIKYTDAVEYCNGRSLYELVILLFDEVFKLKDKVG